MGVQVIPIPTEVVSHSHSQFCVLFPFPWDSRSHGIPVPIGNPVPMHISSLLPIKAQNFILILSGVSCPHLLEVAPPPFSRLFISTNATLVCVFSNITFSVIVSLYLSICPVISATR